MNPATLLARLAVDALSAAGVAHVVLCPGSRSAPLAYALTALPGPDDVVAPDVASRQRLRLHVRHDERVAAFTALGVARGSLAADTYECGAVVTTSGTAAANMAPAVLEAHHANLPLVVVTADRPPALRGTWANQTSELQADLFGDAVRARLDLADTDASADPDAAWQALLATLAAAWGTTDGGRPGPVHLDLGFTEPLLPDDLLPDDASSTSWPGDRRKASVRRVHRSKDVTPVAVGGRSVVVAGDGAGWIARWFADAAGLPLLAEPSSGARSGPNAVGPYRLLLETDLGAQVDRAVVFGRPTLSRPVARLLARTDVEVVVVSPFEDWPDPGRDDVRHVAGFVVPADLLDAEKGWHRRDPDAWLTAWTAAGAAAQQALDAVLDAVADGWSDGVATDPLGPLLAREVAAALQTGDLLVAAASNPIRDLDLAGRPFDVPVDPTAPVHTYDHQRVVANRGLAGIDGTLSTATGAALARDGSFVQVLTGDLAFLHDANALLADPAAPRPDLQVVVLNDDGGGIFHLLEHGERAGRGPVAAQAFERAFGTPHGADLAALCRGYGVPYTRVGDLAALRAALADPVAGTSVVEVLSPRAGLRDLHARIRAVVHGAVAESLRRNPSG